MYNKRLVIRDLAKDVLDGETHLDGKLGISSSVADVTGADHVNPETNNVAMDSCDDREGAALRCADRMLELEELLAHGERGAGAVAACVGTIATEVSCISHCETVKIENVCRVAHEVEHEKQDRVIR